MNRYEEVEVRKKLEEKERQEEKKRKEEIKEKDAGPSSPKTSAANNKDTKKVEKYEYFFTSLFLSHLSFALRCIQHLCYLVVEKILH